MKTMTNRKIPLAMAAFMLTGACNATDEQGSNSSGNRRLSEHRGLADLPHLDGPAIRAPYVRYTETTHQAVSQGLVFFLYPQVRRRNELLGVEYPPNTEVRFHFSGDIVGGKSGLAVNTDRHVGVDFLPISLPINVAPNQQWRLRYADRDFICSSRVGPDMVVAQIAISCASPDYRLNYLFDRERGVTEFQDFCGRSTCTYRLEEPQGLLSRAMLEYMGLPGI